MALNVILSEPLNTFSNVTTYSSADVDGNISCSDDEDVKNWSGFSDELPIRLSINYNAVGMVAVSAALLVMVGATAVGNFLVGLALFRYRSLRTVSNFLIGNLALSDFLLATTILPLSTVNECLGRWVFGRTMCNIWLSLDILYCTASIWNLCIIAFDRYTATIYPLWYREKRSTKQAAVYVMIVWLVAASICLPPLLGWGDPSQNYFYDPSTRVHQCVLFQTAGYVLYSASGSFYIPFLITFFLYVRIFAMLRTRMTSMAKSRDKSHHRQQCHKDAAVNLAPAGITVAEVPRSVVSTAGRIGRISTTGMTSVTTNNCDNIRDISTTTDAAARTASRKHNLVALHSIYSSEQADDSCGEYSTVSCDDGLRSVTSGNDADSSLLMSVDSDAATACDKSPQGRTCGKKSFLQMVLSVRAAAREAQTRGNPVGLEIPMLNSVSYNTKEAIGVSEPLSTNQTLSLYLPVIVESSLTTKAAEPALSTIVCETSSTSFETSFTSRKTTTTATAAFSVAATVTAIAAAARVAPAATVDRSSPAISSAISSKRSNKLTLLGRRLENAKNGKMAAGGEGGGGGGGIGGGRFSKRSEARIKRRSDQRELRATVRMAIIISMFCGMWIGFFVVYVIRGWCPVDCFIPRELEAFFFWLGYCNSSVNPILYTLFNDDFRKAFNKILCSGRGCGGGVGALGRRGTDLSLMGAGTGSVRSEGARSFRYTRASERL